MYVMPLSSTRVVKYRDIQAEVLLTPHAFIRLRASLYRRWTHDLHGDGDLTAVSIPEQ
jgi:hypothetical protein